MRIPIVGKSSAYLALLILVGCNIQPSAPEQAQGSIGESIVLRNHGGDMEGHTPRGFQGMGTGLFAGDNLNPRFPEGDGVQIFLTFDLSAVSVAEVASATLRSEHVSVRGTPFQDLGMLAAEEVRYDAFSATLWNLVPEVDGATCQFASSPEGPFACDVTAAVNSSLAEGYPFSQFRLRFSEAGDSDGIQDMAFFFISDTNTNEPGIFFLELDQ